MDKERKREILIESIDSVREEMINKFDKSNIPIDWGGLEIRQWIADYFYNHMSIPKRISIFNGYSIRRKDYNSHIYSNNMI